MFSINLSKLESLFVRLIHLLISAELMTQPSRERCAGLGCTGLLLGVEFYFQVS